MPVVTNTVLLPDGSGAQYATVVIRLVANATVGTEAPGYVGTSEILGTFVPAVSSEGVWSLTLTANSLITPSGTVYQITTQIPGRPVVVEYVSVPNGAGPYTVSAILTSAPSSITPTELAAHLADTVDAHDASAVSMTAVAGLSTTDTVQAALGHLSNVYNVKAYGAVGDGTTDDTTAIQAAITACAAGGTVFFPKGTYKVTSTLTVTASADSDAVPWQGGGIHLVGVSARGSMIKATTGFVVIDFASNLSSFCSIEKLSFKGPGAAVANSQAVRCNITPHLRVDQVYVRDFLIGWSAYDCTGWAWTDVRTWYCGTGLQLGYNCDSLTFTGCEWRICSTAGVLIGWATGAFTGDSQFCNAITFQGSIFAYNTGTAVKITDKTAQGISFHQGYWEGNPKDMEVGVSGRADTTGPVGLILTGCMFSPTVSPPVAIGIDVYGRPSMRLIGCSTDGASRYTVFVKWNDINGGTCRIEDSYINAVTAALQVGSRNWNTTGSAYQEGIAWGRKQADYIDTVNVPASVPVKETRVYNGSGRILEAWGRYTLGDVLTNQFRMTDSGGVLQVGGGSTEAFITATSVAALPTAGVNYRACLAYVPGNGTTTADTLYVCLMSSTGTYSWKSIVAG